MSHPLTDLKPGDVVLHSLPDKVQANIEVRDRFLARVGTGGLEFAVSDVRRWRPGGTVKVAFRGGEEALWTKIAEATQSITYSCNLTLSFKDGEHWRTWTEQDTDYAADIRISFDDNGYYSLIGTDAVDKSISNQAWRTGGWPHQRTLNLGGYADRLPADYAHTVRHEFLHALGFEHEHQNLRGPCEDEMRWDDDAGYVPTQDGRGAYIADATGREPGLYTYLAGYPNYWDRSRVDHNLRMNKGPDVVVGPFDRASIMLYRFPASFYKVSNGQCQPLGDGQDLSDGDRRGLRLLYGPRPEHYDASAAAVANAVKDAAPKPTAPSGLESLESTMEEGAHALEGLFDRLTSDSRKEWLPQDDPNQKQRKKALNAPRKVWGIDLDALPGLVSTEGVPRPDRPSAAWIADIAPVLAKLALNEVEVRAFWKRPPTSTGGLESLGEEPDLTEVNAIHAERDRHEDFARRAAAAAQNEGAPAALESVSPVDGLIGETAERITTIFKADTAPNGPKGRPSSVEDYARLFREIPLPDIAQSWQTDDMFAWLRLAGPNARELRKVDGQLPDAFSLTAEKYAAVRPGDSLEAAIDEGRAFLSDYGLLADVLKNAKYEGADKYVAAPFGLFVVPKGGGRLVPVAIQCFQTPDPNKNPVFTPKDGQSWQLAKSVFQVADANHHEIVSHLAHTHLVTEVALLATHRQLAPRHPLNRLLLPHFVGTVFINNSARGSLIAAGGAIDRIFAGSIETSQALAVRGVNDYAFSDHMLPNVLDRVGADTIQEYPYRDDAVAVWNATRAWVADYVSLWYRTPADVAQDWELKAWNAELRRPVAAGGLPQFPKITTLDTLIDVVTSMIFTPSAQHAAVNFPQRTDMSYAPAVSGAGWVPEPTEGETVTHRVRLDFMPPLELANEQSSLLSLLGGVYHSRLGQYKTNAFPYGRWFKDKRITDDLLPKYDKALKRIERDIKAANKTRWRPYTHLLPSKIPMSINI